MVAFAVYQNMIVMYGEFVNIPFGLNTVLPNNVN